MIKKFDLFCESKKTEEQALKVLGYSDESDNKNGITDVKKILQDFKDIDHSKNQILLPSIAYFYSKNVGLNSLDEIFSKIPKLLDKKLMNIQLTKNGVKVGDKTYTEWLDFSETVDGINSALLYKEKKKNKKVELELDETIDEPIWSGNGIKIFDGKDVGTCIRLGKNQSFCISQPNNTMFQSYRDDKSSSFYFIYDENQKDNPLNIVVFDNTEHGVELTDETNRTGHIHIHEDDPDSYIKYLKSKNVPVEKMVNKPKTEDEIKEQKLLGTLNKDLKWFIDLSSDYKSKYIGRGHYLSDEQFKYLFDHKLWDLLNQYVNIAFKLKSYQFELVEQKMSLLKSYIRCQYNLIDGGRNITQTFEVLEYFERFGYLDNDKTFENGISTKELKVVLNTTHENVDVLLNSDQINLYWLLVRKYYKPAKFLLKNDYYKKSIEKYNNDINKNLTLKCLNKAIGDNNVEIVELLIKDIDYIEDDIFHSVIVGKNLEIIKLMMDKYSDDFAPDNLLETAYNGSVEVLNFFETEYGVKLIKPELGIDNAAFNNHLDYIKYVVNNYDLDKSKLRGLSNSIINSNKDITEYLLENKLYGNRDLENSFYKSIEYNPEMFFELYKIKDDLRLDSEYFEDFINKSAKYGRIEILKFLHKEGYDIHNNYEHPLINSIYNDEYEIFKYLLENGADATTKDRDNQAMRYAESEYMDEYVKLLKQYGAKSVRVNEKMSNLMSFESFSKGLTTLYHDSSVTDLEAKLYDYNNQNPAIEMEEEIETSNPNFKKWFKDSKVVDSDGKPLKVYHVTTEKFDTFDINHSYSYSFWFTSTLDKIKNGETGASIRPNKEIIIMEVYLSIQNMAGWEEYDKYGVSELIGLGYDGIKLDDDYVVFEPNQIKHINNNGNFNTNSGNIYE